MIKPNTSTPVIVVSQLTLYRNFCQSLYDCHLKEPELMAEIQSDLGDIFQSFTTAEGIRKLFKHFLVLILPEMMDTIDAYEAGGTEFIVIVEDDDGQMLTTLAGTELNW